MNPLHKIQAPGLESSDYGAQVNDQFKNIDENFQRVGSYDFVRGLQGDGLELYEHDLASDIVDNKVVTDSISESILNVIGAEANLSAVGSSTYDQYFLDGTAGKVVLIYKTNDRTDNWKDGLIGMLPYTYLDPRFQRRLLGNIQVYNEIVDLSCVIGWSGASFVRINAFPTIYYDPNESAFCWLIGGSKTGLIAQGPKGMDGRSGNLIVVRTEGTTPIESDRSTVFKIDSYLDGDKWSSLENMSSEPLGMACIVFKTIDEVEGVPTINHSEYWISNIGSASGDEATSTVYTATCSESNKITSIFSWNDIVDIFSNIGKTNTGEGIFLPITDKIIDPNDGSTSQYVHQMMSVGVGGNRGELRFGTALVDDITSTMTSTLLNATITIKRTLGAENGFTAGVYTLQGVEKQDGTFKYAWVLPNSSAKRYTTDLFDNSVQASVTGSYVPCGFATMHYPLYVDSLYTPELYGCSMDAATINKIVADTVAAVVSV